jgi:hypothetical protein
VLKELFLNIAGEMGHPQLWLTLALQGYCYSYSSGPTPSSWTTMSPTLHPQRICGDTQYRGT